MFSLEYWFKTSLQQIQFEIKCPFKLLHTPLIKNNFLIDSVSYLLYFSVLR